MTAKTRPAETPREVLDFWFGELGMEQWFGPESAKADHLIVERLGPAHELAHNGKLAGWRDDPQGALALVLLLDQVPRNSFRGQARAFASDPMALDTARYAVAQGFDKAEGMDDLNRLFFYMPFEHSEDLADQEKAIELMRPLGGGEDWVKYAIQHRDLIARFGRFPHRNRVLGRPYTMEERIFLREGDSGFGQGSASAIFGLDHLVLATPDLDATASAWRDMGFTLSAKGFHEGWGTANYCVMFADHYIELLGREGEGELPPGFEACVARGGGLYGLAFSGTDGAAAAAFLEEGGISARPVKKLNRMATGKIADKMLEFELVYPTVPTCFGPPSFVCVHKTRDLVWQPELLKHPNGAVAIESFRAAVATIGSEVEGSYRALVGDENVERHGEGLRINLWGIEMLLGPDGETGLDFAVDGEDLPDDGEVDGITFAFWPAES